MSTTDELLKRRYRVLGRGSPLFYDKPLHLVRGEGVWLYDADGRRYLDAYNNVPHVGHCHPHVVEAISRQAALLNTHTRYLHEGIVRYAERLTATFDRELSMAFLACTGSEANEIALRMATVCTGHRGIICTRYAYHGNTTAVAQISTVFPPPEGLGPHIRAVPAPDSYRDPARRRWDAAAGRLAAVDRERLRVAPRERPGRRRDAGRHHLLERGSAGASAGVPGEGGRHRAPRGRDLYRGRGPAGLRPDRRVHVGLPALRRGARRRHARQADGQRTPGVRRRGACGACDRVRGQGDVLQHFRRQSGLLRRGQRGARCPREGAAAGERTRSRRIRACRPRTPEGEARPDRRRARARDSSSAPSS